MDDLSFLLENGMSFKEIRRLQEQGIPTAEIAASARRLVDSGRPLTDPREAVKEVLPEFFDERGHFLHNILGDYLTEVYGCCKINGAVHIYDNGVYRPGEEALHGAMVDLLPSLSNAKRRETFQYIKVCRRTPVKELSPPNLIPFRHRVYDLKTGEFLDYSKDLVFLNRFPWDYDPAAPECPAVTDTLNAIANGDGEVVKLLLESFGNCFHLLNSYRGAVALYGPSGSNGKSTLLNLVAGLDTPTAGSIYLDGQPVTGPGADRVVMFQEAALYPWLNVIENVKFGMKLAGLSKEEQRERAEYYLKLVHLEEYKEYPIHKISGGMRQRTALARALAMDSKILLMDEPFSALDKQTSNKLRAELQQVWMETHKTILFITHSVEEAVYLGDRVVVLSPNKGEIFKIHDIGIPRPRYVYTQDFVELRHQILEEVKGEE